MPKYLDKIIIRQTKKIINELMKNKSFRIYLRRELNKYEKIPKGFTYEYISPN